MRSLALISLFTIALSACRPVHDSPRPYEVYPQNAAYFQGLVNPLQTNGKEPVILHEDNYPITLKLYDDGRFQYTLKKLGDGWGTWKYSAADGYLDLYAERTLFVMQMQIRSADLSNPDAIALEFSDRFGPKYLKLLKDSSAH
ncbi:MAG: hypothetical protein V4655_10060 [Bdellovibrionota bacterium]